MRRVTDEELSLVWHYTPKLRKTLVGGQRMMLLPRADGWGTYPVRLEQLHPEEIDARLYMARLEQDIRRAQNRRLFGVWEECARIVRAGLRRHKRSLPSPPERQP